MKNKTFFILGFASLAFSSCKHDNGTSANGTVWAELVESKTVLLKPECWDDEYWNSVNKHVERQKIFNTIVDAVLNGKQKAFNILTDQELTVDEVKDILKNVQLNASGEEESQKITPEDLSMIRMREEWRFDEKEFRLEKHVSRIDLLLKKMDETGVYIGDKALFYVNLN
jgi:Gliding motility associated protein GldN